MLCCIFNYAPHYRLPIYLEIGKEFNAHFYFGERIKKHKIEKLNFNELPGFQKEFKVYFFNFPISWEWTSGMVRLAFKKDYKKYIITPNLFALNQWFFLFLCWVLGKKVYTWEHGLKSTNIGGFWLIQRKLFYTFISGVFLYGNKARRNLIQLGFNERKLQVIYNSLNYDEAFTLRKEITTEPVYSNIFKNNDPVLLFIGRLTKEKKLELLISAHKILFDKGIETNVVLIGGGHASNDLKKQILENGLENRFWFEGELYDENKISKFLYNATLCISPGNVGLTAIHSFSYGLPVITNNNFETQMPEHEIIEEGRTGLFFNEDNPRSLAEKIEWWLINKKERNSIREECFSKIDNFYNPKNQIEIFKKLIGFF